MQNPNTKFLQDFVLDKDLVLNIPSDMCLLSFTGRVIVTGLESKNTKNPNLLKFISTSIFQKYVLPPVSKLTRVIIPSASWAVQLNTGNVMVDSIYQNFRTLANYVSSWSNQREDYSRFSIAEQAQFYSFRLMDELLGTFTTLLNQECFAGRAPNSMIGRITSSPTIEHYEVSIPKSQAISSGIKEGDSVICMRWPVLKTVQIFKARFWENPTIGLPVTAYDSMNADNDGDLCGVIRIPDTVIGNFDIPKFAANNSSLTADYLLTGKNPQDFGDLRERHTIALSVTNGASIGLANCRGHKSDYDHIACKHIDPMKYAPKGFVDKPMSTEEYIESSRYTTQAIGFMKAIIGPIGKTHRALKVVCPTEIIDSVDNIFVPIVQKGLDVAKHGTRLLWTPVSQLLNKGLLPDGNPFMGNREEFATAFSIIMRENLVCDFEDADVMKVANALYNYPGFPIHGGLDWILEKYFPSYYVHVLCKNAARGSIPQTAAWSFIQSEVDSNRFPHYCNI